MRAEKGIKGEPYKNPVDSAAGKVAAEPGIKCPTRVQGILEETRDVVGSSIPHLAFKGFCLSAETPVHRH